MLSLSLVITIIALERNWGRLIMKKLILIILISILVTAGCLQNTSEETENYSIYSHPDTGFTMKYPQSWIIDEKMGDYQVVFHSPDNQASIGVIIDHWANPEGADEGEYGITAEVSNSTPIEVKEKIQISNVEGLKWVFLVSESNREYIYGINMFVQNCPELDDNRILYYIDYDYSTNDTKLEKSMEHILDSIELQCLSSK